MGIFGKNDRAPSTPADERPRTTYATSPVLAPSSPTVAPLYERFARTSTAAGSVLSTTSVAFPSTSAARSSSAYYGDLPPPPSNIFGQSTSSLVQAPGSDLSVDPFASQGSSSAMLPSCTDSHYTRRPSHSHSNPVEHLRKSATGDRRPSIPTYLASLVILRDAVVVTYQTRKVAHLLGRRAFIPCPGPSDLSSVLSLASHDCTPNIHDPAPSTSHPNI